MDKQELNVRAILAGQAPKDLAVTVKGWVRTRRDSKAGISFVHLSDGSSFHPVQVVAPNTPQLRRRGAKAHDRLRGGGDRDDRAVAGQGPAV
jgi:aspartyl/asparaginyl-tRNA synthetase